jgi:glycosyltransferase involved in cell wall biosynthesis
VQDDRHFRDEVEPHIDGEHVVFLGAVGAEERARVLGHAVALLHPIDFDEPFGLSVVESMVCGTPVLAYRRGSMAEVIDEGVTGGIVGSIDEAVSALPAILSLNRRGVHDRAVARFGVERMVDEYLHAYETVLGR